MPMLTLQLPDRDLMLQVTAGRSVREILDATELRVRAGCGGAGTCGACRVVCVEGDVTPPSVSEWQRLRAAERAAGTRLACQVRLRGDAVIRVVDPAPASPWKSLAPGELVEGLSPQPGLREHVLGVAVDLGTTQVRVSLWDRRSGRRLAARRGPNPQQHFGADILNRLAASLEGPGRRAELSGLARDAILNAVRDILARDVGSVAPALPRIGRVVVAGNTAMLALLTGGGAEALLSPDNWQQRVDCGPPDPAAWRTGGGLPNAELLVAAPVAGFIGSDLVADLVATGLTHGPAGSLLLDFGTNTEIAWWDGGSVHATSVPGGPAFEGAGQRFGTAADPGAIDRVTARGTAVECRTVGGAAPVGFCGSGLVDAVALLVGAGVLKPSGRFAAQVGGEGYRVHPELPQSALAAADVDLFQRAKAATAAATATLLESAGSGGWEDVRRVYVCGAFGRALDPANARAVGLLPPVDPARVEVWGETTLAGCERALLAAHPDATFDDVARRIRVVNLSADGAFEDAFAAHLRLAPMPPLTRGRPAAEAPRSC